MKTSAFTTSLDWKARSMMPTQLLRFSCVTFVPSGIRSSAACHGSAAFSASERKLSERQRTQRGTAATELREAFGVRGACSRFTTAPASWTHSKRFAWQFIQNQARSLRASLTIAATRIGINSASSQAQLPEPVLHFLKMEVQRAQCLQFPLLKACCELRVRLELAEEIGIFRSEE